MNIGKLTVRCWTACAGCMMTKGYLELALFNNEKSELAVELEHW